MYSAFDVKTISSKGKSERQYTIKDAQSTGLYKAFGRAEKACRKANGKTATSYNKAKKERRGNCACELRPKKQYICECTMVVKCRVRKLSSDQWVQVILLKAYVKNSKSEISQLYKAAKSRYKAGSITLSHFNSIKAAFDKHKRLKKDLGDITNPLIKAVYIDQMQILKKEIKATVTQAK